MRVLVVDTYLCHGLPIAQRLRRDGHEVMYASIWGPESESPYMSTLGLGMGFELAPDNWMKGIGWADVATVTGSSHRGKIVEYLRKNGVPVAGPGPWGTRLELDRAYGREIFREIGLKPPEVQRFFDPDKLVAYVKKNPNRYVLKIDQTARAFLETFVGSDPEGEDVAEKVRMLAPKLAAFPKDGIALHLEEFIPGTEVAVEGWFNGKELVGPLMVTYDGDGGFAYDLSVDSSKLVDPEAITRAYAKRKFRGLVNINGMLTDDGEYRPVEWTPRWGNGLTEFFCHSVSDLGEMLLGVATGRKVETVRSALKDRMVLIVDAKTEEIPEHALDIVTTEDLPVVRKNSSFWATYPAKIRDKWLSLPVVNDRFGRRVAAYVADAPTLDKAFREVDALAGDVSVSGAMVLSGMARKELTKRVDRIQRFAEGTDWISRTASEFKHIFGSPLR
jgi:phosphoribosylamine-glycine ligase